MIEGPEIPDEGDSAGSIDPSAALLRRAISHVESLLNRMERPGGDAPATELPRLSSLPPVEVSTTLSGVVSADTSGSQAEALSMSLRAHEEVHRMRAEAAADGERVLAEARQLGDRLRAEARDAAVELVMAARADADAIIAAARAEAAESVRVMVAEAVRESDQIRELAQAEAATLAQAEATRAQSLEVLSAVHRCVDEVRTSMHGALGGLGESLAQFDASAATIESLLSGSTTVAVRPHIAAESAPTAPTGVSSAAAGAVRPSAPAVRSADSAMDILDDETENPSVGEEETGPTGSTRSVAMAGLRNREPRDVQTTWVATDRRRPLGLLFGAPRA